MERFDNEYFAGILGYNRLILSKLFYKRFINYQYILIYQLDACIFEDKLNYWLLKDVLSIRGHLYLHRSAKIQTISPNAKMIIYGMSVYDFSKINLGHPNARMVTRRDVVINKFCNIVIWNCVIKIGNNVLFNNYCSLNCMKEIQIEDNTWFGEGVRFYDHNHKCRDSCVPFTEQGFATGKINIGKNVWIGSNNVIFQNVLIGDNVIIGAGNVIYKSVPANSIVKANSMQKIEELQYE